MKSTSRLNTKSFANKSRSRCLSPKENEIIEALKPIVNDFTKLCRKSTSPTKRGCNHGHSHNNCKSETKLNLKLKFIEEKEIKNENWNGLEEYIKLHIEAELKCPLCNDLFNEPLVCYKCESIFCSECIKSHLKKSHKCPSCFSMIFLNLLNKADDIVKENYNKVLIKCPNKGCRDTYNANEIKGHYELCVFKDNSTDRVKHINKIVYQNEDDPYVKNHMLNYLSTLNSDDCVKSQSNKENSDIKIAEQLQMQLIQLKGKLKYTNDYIFQTTSELAQATKNTNEVLKNAL